jgi:predicted transcriptional regulator
MNPEMKKISLLLRERRRELGVSRNDLARLSGLCLHSLSDLETGKGNPTLGSLSQVLRVLGLEMAFRPAATEMPASADEECGKP